MSSERGHPVDTERGDVDAMYRAHGHSVLRRARSILGSDAESRDVLQEIFVSLLDRPDQYRGHASITTWLYSVTTHACLNRLRNDRTRRGLLHERAITLAQLASESPERAVMLRQLLRILPTELREVAIYHYVDG
ncbi:MAG: RNA polymerase sigma factor, partial [Polyangiaceae bacterium]